MGRNIIDSSLPIPTFYSGRSILITGVTGYLGKALVEKLLRSCPDTREIFLLMRPQKNMNIDERLQQLLTSPLFDRLRNEQPRSFEKLIPIKGDIAAEGLGLSDENRDMLIEKVSIIFHVAANVRFNDTLKNTFITNIRSTRDICILGEHLKNLVALVHVSTTYSQIDKPVVDEIVYPIDVDWRKAIKIAETLDEHVLQIFMSKYIGTMRNNYTFSKRLAEQVINDYSASLPCAIFRPSIVSPSLNEPVKGWVDNFNGPMALLVSAGKGIVRVLNSEPYVRDNYIPIDIVVKAMIATGWKLGTMTNNNDTQDTLPLVYNCASEDSKNISRSAIKDVSDRAMLEYPLEGIIWAPGMFVVRNSFVYYMLVFLLHLIPALFIDGLLRLTGNRPRLLKIQRKVFVSNGAVVYFLSNNWDFRNGKLLSLSSEIPSDNQKDFGFAKDLNYNFDKIIYYKFCLIGSKKYLLHENMDKLDATRLHFKRMIWIDKIVKILVGLVFLWMIFKVVAAWIILLSASKHNFASIFISNITS